MRLCYNKFRKILLKLTVIFSLLVNSAFALTFDVLVVPADILRTKENYYGFSEVSEIIANDLIRDFNLTNGKIKSPDLYTLKTDINGDEKLKNAMSEALSLYKTSGKIDYNAFKILSEHFACKSILLISSYAMTDKSSSKRGVWEVLEVSSAFENSLPCRLETSIVLLDNVNNLVMWSNLYTMKLGNNTGKFVARSFSEANEIYEKIRLYSKTVLAPSASQNIVLRFFPKSVRPIMREVNENSGGAIRFEKNLPEKPKKYEPQKEEFYGEMIYGI